MIEDGQHNLGIRMGLDSTSFSTSEKGRKGSYLTTKRAILEVMGPAGTNVVW